MVCPFRSFNSKRNLPSVLVLRSNNLELNPSFSLISFNDDSIESFEAKGTLFKRILPVLDLTRNWYVFFLVFLNSIIAVIFAFKDIKSKENQITKMASYLKKESIPGMFGIPSFATAANSLSLIVVACCIALFRVRIR